MTDDNGKNDWPAVFVTDTDEWHRYGKHFFYLCRLLFYLIGITAVIGVVFGLRDVLLPVGISMILAYLLDPVIDWFEDRKVPRPLGIVIVLLLGTFALVAFVLFLYPLLQRHVLEIAGKVPILMEKIQTDFLPWVEKRFDVRVPSTLEAAIGRYRDTVAQKAPQVLSQVGKWSWGLMSQTGQIVLAILNMVIIPIFTFYFLKDFDEIEKTVTEFIPPSQEDAVMKRLRKMDVAVGQWCRGQLQVASLLALILGLALGTLYYFLSVDVQAGIVIGILSGFLNVIPYLGFVIGIALALLMVIVEWAGLTGILGVLVVYGVIQGIESYYITPRIVGDKVGLSPVTIIIVILIGGEVMGLLGILISVPVAGAIKTLKPDLIRLYKSTRFYQGKGKGLVLFRNGDTGNGDD